MIVERPPIPPEPVLVVGLGRAGDAAARALAERLGPDAVYASDDHDGPETRVVAAGLADLGVHVALGRRPPGWPRPAAVVKSPGIPAGAACLPAGVATIDELELGWRLSGERVAAITGTNGKGTTAWLLGQLLEGSGTPAVVCGNFELGVPFSAASVVPGGVFVVESSSYQLETPGTMLPEVALLTNLGEDHRDRHGTRETYAPIKRRLFVRGDRVVPAAVLCADDDFARELAGELRERGARVTTYGRAVDADYRIRALRYDLTSAELTVAAPGGELRLRTRLPGDHNALNAVGALAAATALGVEPAAAAEALADAAPVPGRFEPVDIGQPFTAVVDFAHNPDGYTAVLTAARRLARGHVRVLIGVRGGMDPFKRPAMGEVAATLADQVFVTSGEDHVGESRERRIEQLLEGAMRGDAELVVEPERDRAIERLVAAAEPGDVLLVLGRGAQASPLVEGERPFDDRDALRAAIRQSRE